MRTTLPSHLTCHRRSIGGIAPALRGGATSVAQAIRPYGAPVMGRDFVVRTSLAP